MPGFMPENVLCCNIYMLILYVALVMRTCYMLIQTCFLCSYVIYFKSSDMNSFI